MENYFESLWRYLLLSSPYLLLGLLLSGLVHVLISVETIKKYLGKNNLKSIATAAAVGVPLPLCSCSVIPAAVTLRKAGASKGATSSFLISTPETGIDSILVTYGLMGFPMAILRPIAAFLTAFLAGVFQFVFNAEEDSKMNPPISEKKSCCAHNEPPAKKRFWLREALHFGFGDLVNDIALWLTIGILGGAMIEVLIPPDYFLGMGPHLGRLAILAIGIPMYICASASTPIAVSLMAKGLSPGSALLFLMVGPATNFSNLTVLKKYLGWKGIFINILTIAGVGLLFSYLVDAYLADWILNSWKDLPLSSVHEHIQPVEIYSALILIGLLLKGMFKENIVPLFKKKVIQPHNH